MAANVSVPNNFIPGAPSDADAVDVNFAALVTWINTNVPHLDGSKAFTSVPSGPTADPTTADQLTRKAYVDGQHASPTLMNVKLTRTSSFTVLGSSTSTVTWQTEDADVGGFIAAPATTLVVPAGGAGLYAFGMRFDVDFSGSHSVKMTIGGNQVFSSTGVTTAVGHISVGAIIPLKVSDVITIQVTNANGSTITVSNPVMYLTRIAA